jgi:hypothetical protein
MNTSNLIRLLASSQFLEPRQSALEAGWRGFPLTPNVTFDAEIYYQGFTPVNALRI